MLAGNAASGTCTKSQLLLFRCAHAIYCAQVHAKEQAQLVQEAMNVS